MKIFVAGGTGVLGRASLPPLAAAGHQVRSSARGADKAALVRSLGAEPVEVNLFDPRAVRQAIAGSDAVIRLTTKIGSLMKLRDPRAWNENNRLRTEGARVLVDAAILEGVPLYISESVTYVYRDAGDAWLTEDSPTDDGGSAVLRATLEGEAVTARFTQNGGRGIVLRFSGFYGADSPSTVEMAAMARRRMFSRMGSGKNYFSSIYVPDAGRAVAASLSLPAGVYNISDDNPVDFADYVRIAAAALRAPRPLRLPRFLGKLMMGHVWSYFSRSLRVSNARFKELSGWKPAVRGVSEGWPLVAAELDSLHPAK